MKNNNSKKEEHPLYRLLATCFGLSKITHVPGMIGSLLALPIWLYLTSLFKIYFVVDVMIYTFWFLVFVLLFLFGAIAASYVSNKTHMKDPSSVIIDEMLGQLITLVLTQHLIIGYVLSPDQFANMEVYGVYFLLNLVLFRIFDIFKPAIVIALDKKVKGGCGIMFDDIIAGITTAIVINILYFIF